MNCRSAGLVNLLAFDILVQVLLEVRRYLLFPNKKIVMEFSLSLSLPLQFAISSGIITACTMTSLFKYSDKSVVFMYFFSFGLSAIMLSFLISTFFTRAKTAVAVGTLSFLGAYFPYYTVNDQAVPM